jgi:[ribosomal protein S18]-alanine N-acetyltransferase
MVARYRIRLAAPADARALLAIERQAFRDPWSDASFRDALTSAWTFGLIAENGQGIIGYLIARDVARMGEILNLAVAPGHRRRGIGGALLEAGIEALRRREVDEIFLEVRESNRSAQALYLGHGFRAVGQRSAYYRNPKEDALVLRLVVEQSA